MRIRFAVPSRKAPPARIGRSSRSGGHATTGLAATVATLTLAMASGVLAQSTDPCPCSETKECPKPAALTPEGGGSASNYPGKPIRLVVPFAAGGTVDTQARLIASRLTESLRVQVVVDNRAGNGGLIGAETVARAAPDGYTLLVASVGSQVVAPLVYQRVPFDPVRDLSPVASLFASPHVLVVHPSVPAQTPKELIEYLKSRPEKVNYASSGAGGSDHLAGELFQQLSGTKMVHVPYKGGAPAMTDLIGGQVQLMFLSLTAAVDPVKAGRLRAIGIASGQRSSTLPQVATFEEAGLRDFVVKSWTGVFAPAGTPKAIADKLHAEIDTALRSGEVVSRMAATPVEPCPQSRAAFVGLIRDSGQKWSRVVRQANIRVE